MRIWLGSNLPALRHAVTPCTENGFEGVRTEVQGYATQPITRKCWASRRAASSDVTALVLLYSISRCTVSPGKAKEAAIPGLGMAASFTGSLQGAARGGSELRGRDADAEDHRRTAAGFAALFLLLRRGGRSGAVHSHRSGRHGGAGLPDPDGVRP